MRYLGVDQSLTSTGMAVIDRTCPEPVYLERVAPGALRGAGRLAHIRNTVDRVIKDHFPAYVAMEGYAYDATGRVFELGELGGVLKVLFYDLSIPLVVVPPATLKLYATGNGQASKERVKDSVEEKWGQVIDQDDLCDSYVLARIARAFCINDSIVRHELEALKSLRDTGKKAPTFKSKGRIKVSV